MTTKLTAKYFEYVQNIECGIFQNKCAHSLYKHTKISDNEYIKSVQWGILPCVVICVT